LRSKPASSATFRKKCTPTDVMMIVESSRSVRDVTMVVQYVHRGAQKRSGPGVCSLIIAATKIWYRAM
jgi:hypothetical protein